MIKVNILPFQLEEFEKIGGQLNFKNEIDIINAIIPNDDVLVVLYEKEHFSIVASKSKTLAKFKHSKGFSNHFLQDKNIKSLLIQEEDELFRNSYYAKAYKNSRHIITVPLMYTKGNYVGSIVIINHESQLATSAKKVLKSIGVQVVDKLKGLEKVVADLKLKEEAEKFFDLSLDMLCVANVDGFFKKINPAFTNILGYKVTDLLEKPFTYYIHPNDLEKTFKEVEKLSKGATTINFRNRYRTKKGDYKTLAWHSAPDLNTGNLYAIARDVTPEQEQINERTAELEAINNTALRLEFDPKGHITSINRNALKLFGYHKKDITGLHHSCLMLAEDCQSKGYQEFWKELNNGKAFVNEFKRVAKNGEVVWIKGSYIPIKNEEGQVIRILKVAFDITKQKNAEQELIKQRETLDNVIKGTNLGTWEWNVQTGETIFNDRWADIIGYKLKELEPISIDTWMKYAHPDDLEESGNRLNAHFEGKSEFYDFESRMQHKNGEWVWVHDRGRVVSWTEDGKPLWMYGTHQEITKRKRYEAELAKSNEELDQFAYVVSHDLKAPLRAISTLTTFLKEDLEGQLDEESEKHMDLIIHRTLKLEKIIQDILSYSRIGRTKIAKEKVQLNDLFLELEDSLKNNDHTEIKIQKDMPTLLVERIYLVQIFSNLISNAIKYNDKKQCKIDIGFKHQDRQLNIFVKDNGKGIDKIYFDKIFQVFNSIEKDDSVESTGIGLSTVKKIVTELGGEIKVSSELGKGSTFTVIISDNYLS